MPRKIRRVSLGIKILSKGKSVDVVGDLLEAVKVGSKTGDYAPPNGIMAVIYWTNPPGPKKFDEFSNAMAESASSSVGFDKLVTNYLEKRRKGK